MTRPSALSPGGSPRFDFAYDASGLRLDKADPEHKNTARRRCVTAPPPSGSGAATSCPSCPSCLSCPSCRSSWPCGSPRLPAPPVNDLLTRSRQHIIDRRRRSNSLRWDRVRQESRPAHYRGAHGSRRCRGAAEPARRRPAPARSGRGARGRRNRGRPPGRRDLEGDRRVLRAYQARGPAALPGAPHRGRGLSPGAVTPASPGCSLIPDMLYIGCAQQ